MKSRCTYEFSMLEVKMVQFLAPFRQIIMKGYTDKEISFLFFCQQFSIQNEND